MINSDSPYFRGTVGEKKTSDRNTERVLIPRIRIWLYVPKNDDISSVLQIMRLNL